MIAARGMQIIGTFRELENGKPQTGDGPPDSRRGAPYTVITFVQKGRRDAASPFPRLTTQRGNAQDGLLVYEAAVRAGPGSSERVLRPDAVRVHKLFGKVGKLDKKLTLSAQLATLVRQQVAAVNSCAFCMDSNRWAAINRESEAAAKLDALGDYSSSRHFDARERAALDFVTQVTQDKTSSPATFAELRRHFSEREICELTWLVASEHLYNMNNIALNIGSSGMCQTAPVEVSSAPVG
jgi:alkylhydroperoxidase family enzyme